MLRHELVVRRGGPKQHLAELQPVAAARAAQQRLEIAAEDHGARAQIHALRLLQQPGRNIPVREGHPFEQEAAGLLDTLLVRAPVLHAVVGVVAHQIEALVRRDVPDPALLDLREGPWLDQRAARKHVAADAAVVAGGDILGGHDVAVAVDRHGRAGLDAAADVVPVRQLRVALLAGAPVHGDQARAPRAQQRHQRVRVGRRLVVDADAHFDRERAVQHGVHPLHDPLQARAAAEQGRAGAGTEHKVDRAAAVDVDKVHIRILPDQLRAACHDTLVRTADLDTKDVFTFVATQQRPLGLVPLEQIRSHSHLAARDVAAKLLAHAAEREVANGRQRREVQLVAEVDLLALLVGQRSDLAINCHVRALTLRGGSWGNGRCAVCGCGTVSHRSRLRNCRRHIYRWVACRILDRSSRHLVDRSRRHTLGCLSARSARVCAGLLSEVVVLILRDTLLPSNALEISLRPLELVCALAQRKQHIEREAIALLLATRGRGVRSMRLGKAARDAELAVATLRVEGACSLQIGALLAFEGIEIVRILARVAIRARAAGEDGLAVVLLVIHLHGLAVLVLPAPPLPSRLLLSALALGIRAIARLASVIAIAGILSRATLVDLFRPGSSALARHGSAARGHAIRSGRRQRLGRLHPDPSVQTSRVHTKTPRPRHGAITQQQRRHLDLRLWLAHLEGGFRPRRSHGGLCARVRPPLLPGLDRSSRCSRKPRSRCDAAPR
eukprot:m.30141 g.30141  ORF g.30141 m.30141 type:complete len:726 (+) comp4749_c0_seq2:126-2303(+)